MRTDSQSPDLTNRRLLLPSLIERVVQHSDKDALDEFHNTRRPFRLGQGERLRFVEYVSALRDLQLTDRSSSPRLTEEALDRAHSLTVDRFLNLPDAESRENVTPLTNGNHHKTDCRLYFGAFLERFRTMEPVHAASDIERELLASRLLQSHVNRHFKLCVLEAQRSANDLVSRYEWKINGRSLYLWFPAEFPGHDRRAWLEANVPDPDPCRPGEKARVQGIIESRMGRRGVVGMEECECVEDRSARMDRLFSWAFLYGITVHGLVETVAQEKAASIERQRPAIRSLGRERLKALIHEVFERLEDPSKPAHETATRFGLSPASFSRFAGSRWREEPPSEKEGRVPDLWLNVARVLSNHPGFVEAAKVSGVWPQVERVL